MVCSNNTKYEALSNSWSLIHNPHSFKTLLCIDLIVLRVDLMSSTNRQTSFSILGFPSCPDLDAGCLVIIGNFLFGCPTSLCLLTLASMKLHGRKLNFKSWSVASVKHTEGHKKHHEEMWTLKAHRHLFMSVQGVYIKFPLLCSALLFHMGMWVMWGTVKRGVLGNMEYGNDPAVQFCWSSPWFYKLSCTVGSTCRFLFSVGRLRAWRGIVQCGAVKLKL